MRNIFGKLFLDVFANTGQKFADSTRHDPYRNFNYSVWWTGEAIYGTGWNFVSGLKVRADFKEYKQGGNNGVADVIYDGVAYEPITMERGFSEDESVVQSFAKQFDTNGMGIKKSNKWTVTISVKDRNLNIVKVIKLTEVYIIGFETGDLDSMGQGIYMNRITIGFTGAEISNS